MSQLVVLFILCLICVSMEGIFTKDEAIVDFLYLDGEFRKEQKEKPAKESKSKPKETKEEPREETLDDLLDSEEVDTSVDDAEKLLASIKNSSLNFGDDDIDG